MSDAPPQLAWPLQLDSTGTFAEVAQDSDDEVKRAAGLVCDTRPGQLPWAPSFGSPSPLGSNDPQATAASIEAAIARHEPRGTFVVTVLSDVAIDGRNLHLSLDTEATE